MTEKIVKTDFKIDTETPIYGDIKLIDIFNFLETDTYFKCQQTLIYACMEFDSNQTDYESKSGKFEIGVIGRRQSEAAVLSFLLRCIFDKRQPSELFECAMDCRTEVDFKGDYVLGVKTVKDVIHVIDLFEDNSLQIIDEKNRNVKGKNLKKLLFKMHRYTLQEIKDYLF